MKKILKYICIPAIFYGLGIAPVLAQDPHLPSVNLGYSNMQSGNSRPPGWYYVQYIQVFQPDRVTNADGNAIADATLTSSLVLLQQLTFISNQKLAGGNVGFSLLLPFVKSSPENVSGVPLPNVNPNPLGDIIAAPSIQWYNKHLFGIPLAHRFGINIAFPTGSFQSRYAINPGAHRFRVFPNYQFTLTPIKKFAVSIKNNLYYSFNEVGNGNRPAIAYNLNYAFEFTVVNRLVVEGVGYYLTQLGQDSFNGDDRYYQSTYNINDTREKVWGFGPGIGYRTNGGLSVELKSFWETGAKNRQEGYRGTAVFSYKL